MIKDAASSAAASSSGPKKGTKKRRINPAAANMLEEAVKAQEKEDSEVRKAEKAKKLAEDGGEINVHDADKFELTSPEICKFLVVLRTHF